MKLIITALLTCCFAISTMAATPTYKVTASYSGNGAWTSANEIDVHWKISSEIADKGTVTTGLREFYTQALSSATKCISKALRDGSNNPPAISFKLRSLSILDKKLEDRQIKQTHLAFEKENGDLINGLGNFNSEIYIFSSPKTDGNYVPVVYSDKLRNLYRNIPKSDRTDNFLSKDPAKHTFSKELGEFMQEYVGLWNLYINGENYFNNVIYLFPVESYAPKGADYDFILAQTSGVLAHELLHAWGGLNDTYSLENGDAERDNSIMANTMNENVEDGAPLLSKINCTLSKQQVDNIQSYIDSKSSPTKVPFSPRLQVE